MCVQGPGNIYQKIQLFVDKTRFISDNFWVGTQLMKIKHKLYFILDWLNIYLYKYWAYNWNTLHLLYILLHIDFIMNVNCVSCIIRSRYLTSNNNKQDLIISLVHFVLWIHYCWCYTNFSWNCGYQITWWIIQRIIVTIFFICSDLQKIHKYIYIYVSRKIQFSTNHENLYPRV